MFQSFLLWTLCLSKVNSKATVSFHGLWQLKSWEKLFSHAPLRIKGCIESTLFIAWKKCCVSLVWNGFIRYKGNSLATRNVPWSFFLKSSQALLLRCHSWYMHLKSINTIAQILGIFLSFFVTRKRYQLGIPYRIPWHTLCTFIFKLQVPFFLNLDDIFKYWALAHSYKNWWTT